MRTAYASVALIWAATVLGGAATAHARPNDITLQRFVSLETNRTAQGTQLLAVPNDPAFRAFARDLGLVFTPRLGTAPQTLGQAGFAIQVDQSVSTVNASDEHWQLGMVSGDPSGSLQTTTVRARKGLPFGLELGGLVTALGGSELMAVGAEMRWAIHEDFFWPIPDLAVRGYVNSVLGDTQLNLTVTGWDLVAGTQIGVGNVMNITPYAGYNMGVIVSASRLIDATPLDPTPPFSRTPSNPPDPNLVILNASEAVFDVETQVVHGGLFGVRFQFAFVDLNFQASLASTVQTYTTSLAFNF